MNERKVVKEKKPRRNRAKAPEQVPLFVGFSELYIQFEDFKVRGSKVPEHIQRAVKDVENISRMNKELLGKERKAILVSVKIGRELYPYIKARVTPVQNASGTRGDEYLTYWMP